MNLKETRLKSTEAIIKLRIVVIKSNEGAIFNSVYLIFNNNT